MMKSEIRSRMMETRNHLSEEQRNQWNSELFQNLADLKEYRACDKLFTYISFQSEPDTIDIIKLALKDKKQVYVPRVEGKIMQFYEIEGFNKLERSHYGILEPEIEEEKRYSCKIQGEETFNLILLPGLAFDMKGNRIGYGGGFYDKYLSEFSETHFYKIALTYEFQILNHINSSEYDRRADLLLTPERKIYC